MAPQWDSEWVPVMVEVTEVVMEVVMVEVMEVVMVEVMEVVMVEVMVEVMEVVMVEVMEVVTEVVTEVSLSWWESLGSVAEQLRPESSLPRMGDIPCWASTLESRRWSCLCKRYPAPDCSDLSWSRNCDKGL
jgi:hypothetical protein